MKYDWPFKTATIILSGPHLEEVRGNAWSFGGMYPPDTARYIGEEVRAGETYYYYMDADGQYFFQSKSGYIYMEQTEQRRRERMEQEKKEKIRNRHKKH